MTDAGADDLDLGADGEANHRLGLLRAGTSGGDLGQRSDLAPGIFLVADPPLEIAGRWASPAGRILEIEATPRGSGAWFALHVGLPARDLSARGVLGLACRSTAPEVVVVQPCLRSGTPDGFEDCFFDKHVLSRSEEASHLDALAVQRRDNLPPQAPWRELILFLPVRSFRWSLIDLRVFIA